MKNQDDQNVTAAVGDAETLSVVVTYQDTPTRDRAIRVCDHLVANFGVEFSFGFSWWRFDYLADPNLAEQATAAAVRADIILFSAHAGYNPAQHVQRWIDAWAARRPDVGGALVALIGLVDDPQTGLSPMHFYLRSVADRARMDYLPQAVLTLSQSEHGSLERVLKRAETRTSFLDDILRRSQPAERWGINE